MMQEWKKETGKKKKDIIFLNVLMGLTFLAVFPIICVVRHTNGEAKKKNLKIKNK